LYYRRYYFYSSGLLSAALLTDPRSAIPLNQKYQNLSQPFFSFVNIATTIKQSIAKRPQDVLHSAPRSWLHHQKIRIPVPKSRHLIKNARVVVDATVGTALMVVRVNRQTEPSILMLLGGTAPPPSNNRQGLKEWYAEEVTQRRHNVHTPKKCSTYYIHTHQVLP
jgi:hypothetical protein